MDSPFKVVNGKLICLKQNHNETIEMIIMDNQASLSDRLLCQKCVKDKQETFKFIRIETAQDLIKEKLQKLEQKNKILNGLIELTNEMINIRLCVIQQIDEILSISQSWIKDNQKIERKPDVNNFMQEFLTLNLEDQINLNHQNIFENIDLKIKKLMKIDDYQSWYNKFKETFNFKTQQQDFTKAIQQYIPQSDNKVQLITSLKQDKACFAIAFNNSGSLMATGYDKDIKVWQIEKGIITEKKLLKGHSFYVLCLVFSKKCNWFASGSYDNTIQCWKEEANQEWKRTSPEISHTGSVSCVILNKEEDQLISCSGDNTIKVWRVNCQLNQMKLDYTLQNKHTSIVYCLSLNEQETTLVSCSRDKTIIVWSKGQNTKWEYMNEITMNAFGFRICFFGENQIAWQQSNLGLTHIFELKNRQLIERQDLNLNLNEEKEDDNKFPSIRNNNKQVIIQKHSRYVYILKYGINGQLQKFAQPIDCNDKSNFGSLTEDGQYFAVWNAGTKDIRVYKINYD